MEKLKAAVIVPDGAADEPRPELGGRTPLEAARTPNMDRIAASGVTGTAVTVPPGMTPGSDVANLSLMGYDPRVHYGGRAPVEAANLGIEIPDGWTAFRCNLVATDGGRMLDYSAGHITQDDAERAVKALQEALGDGGTRFFPGKSYRNILLLEGGFDSVECTPPHDITGREMEPYLPRGEGSGRVLELMRLSRGVLAGLEGMPADTIWPWSQGRRMELASFASRYGVTGKVISAVDLVCGLGRLAGLEPVDVPGATGYLDTDYAAKGRAAVEAMESGDFVFVHVEAPDEASHTGDVEEKVLALERFDESVAGPLLAHMSAACRPYRLLVAPDHPTLTRTRTHDAGAVPFAVCGYGVTASGAAGFNEKAAARGPRIEEGWTLMGKLTGPDPW